MLKILVPLLCVAVSVSSICLATILSMHGDRLSQTKMGNIPLNFPGLVLRSPTLLKSPATIASDADLNALGNGLCDVYTKPLSMPKIVLLH